ncbi:MAG TPA: hypothetical protein PLA50_20455 [Bacteroidia bacterium]|nr:hypothetical protein [Bacteroidia bacterium]
MKKFLLLVLACTPLLLLTVSCEKKGPAQKAGEKIDEAIDKAVGN